MKNKLTATDYQKKKTRERRKRDFEHKEHLKDLANNKVFGVCPCDHNRQYTKDDDNVAYYRQGWRGKMSKFFKKRSNEKVRRSDEEVFRGGLYRKLFDFWWSLW